MSTCAMTGSYALPSALLMARSGPLPLRPNELPPTGVIVLDPQEQEWVGQPFILADYIDIGQTLMRGHWIVVLYSSDCEHCQVAVPLYEQLAERSAADARLPKIALIEIPPYAEPGDRLVGPNSVATVGCLSDKRVVRTDSAKS